MNFRRQKRTVVSVAGTRYRYIESKCGTMPRMHWRPTGRRFIKKRTLVSFLRFACPQNRNEKKIIAADNAFAEHIHLIADSSHPRRPYPDPTSPFEKVIPDNASVGWGRPCNTQDTLVIVSTPACCMYCTCIFFRTECRLVPLLPDVILLSKIHFLVLRYALDYLLPHHCFCHAHLRRGVPRPSYYLLSLLPDGPARPRKKWIALYCYAKATSPQQC